MTANPTGRDVSSFVKEAKRRIAAMVELPHGVYMVFSGTAEESAAAQRELALHSGLAGVGIVLLLSMAFGGRRNLLLVLANIPFAMVGGIFAVFASRWLLGSSGLTLGSLVGFVTLFGITMRNSIMLVSHFDHLVNNEGVPWSLETAIRGASDRVVPILMTALVTGLGLLPLALGAGSPGREIEGPMAIVILGGLLTSTALNLLVLPTLAHRYGHFGAPGRRPD
ncbi:MAG: efflux RND transporter permease subunit [Myxococcota bacterium]